MLWSWIYPDNFFAWLLSASEEEVEGFEKNLGENIRALTELMGETWLSMMVMPYKFFIQTIEWKRDLEDKKKKMIEERNKEQESQQRKNANIQKANEKRAAQQQRRGKH